jgi:hypothetical protein
MRPAGTEVMGGHLLESVLADLGLVSAPNVGHLTITPAAQLQLHRLRPRIRRQILDRDSQSTCSQATGADVVLERTGESLIPMKKREVGMR